MITDELIEEKIKNTERDKYGQIIISNCTISNLFPDYDEEKIKKYLKTSKKYQLSLYGGKLGQFYAINKRNKMI